VLCLLPWLPRPVARRLGDGCHSVFCDAASSSLPTHTATRVPITPAQVTHGAARVEAPVSDRRRCALPRGANTTDC
jgi:hypothetical protein